MKWWLVRMIAAVGIAASLPAFAQTLPEQAVEVDGETLRFALRTFPVEATSIDLVARIEPVSALDTAKLLSRFLTAGNIEDAALLSNAPRRRFEVLTDYKAAVGDDGFKEVFNEYFDPANRLLGEIIMGSHSLLVWHLGARYAGQYYVQVEGKVLIDDVPNETRLRLRKVLEAVRSGRLSLQSP